MANSNKFSGGAVELTGTAQPSDVLKGQSFYNTNEENKLTGTLELTGDVTPNDVAAGKSFYSNNAKVKQTGTLPVRNAGAGEHIMVWNNNLYICKIPEGIYKYNSGNLTSPEVLVPASLLGNATASDVLIGKTFSSQNGAEMTGTLNPLSKLGFSNIPSGTWEFRRGSLNYANVNSNPNIIPLTLWVTFAQQSGTPEAWVKYGENKILSVAPYSYTWTASLFCSYNLNKQQISVANIRSCDVTTWLEKTGG